MQKCTYREVRVLLGGLVRLVGFVRTWLGFKVTGLPPKSDWLELKFSFKADYFATGDSIQARNKFPPTRTDAEMSKKLDIEESGVVAYDNREYL